MFKLTGAAVTLSQTSQNRGLVPLPTLTYASDTHIFLQVPAPLHRGSHTQRSCDSHMFPHTVTPLFARSLKTRGLKISKPKIILETKVLVSKHDYQSLDMNTDFCMHQEGS